MREWTKRGDGREGEMQGRAAIGMVVLSCCNVSSFLEQWLRDGLVCPGAGVRRDQLLHCPPCPDLLDDPSRTQSQQLQDEDLLSQHTPVPHP